MDRDVLHWNRTSDQYNMNNWNNAYLGYDEDLMFNYQFKGFPSKRVYDKNNQAMEFDFQQIEDMLKK